MSGTRSTEWWHKWFLGLAQYVASASKDPSTQTGAVIIDSENRVVSMGYNGLARGVHDSPERLNNRELKYKIIVHCERNAIIFAKQDLKGCKLYTWPFMSCATCAAMVIQSGITEVIAPPMPPDLRARWAVDCDLAYTMFDEAGIKIQLIGESACPQ